MKRRKKRRPAGCRELTPCFDRAGITLYRGESLRILPELTAGFADAVVTDPRRVSVALEPRAAIEEIQKLRERPGFAVLEVPNDIVDRWIDLVLRYSVTKQNVIDLQLVAVMLTNGVKRVCEKSDYPGARQ